MTTENTFFTFQGVSQVPSELCGYCCYHRLCCKAMLLMRLLMMVRVHVRNMDDVASRMIMSVGSAVRLERREKPNWRRTAAVSSAAG